MITLPYIEMSAVVCSALIITLLFIIRITTFVVTDQPSELQPFIPKKKGGYAAGPAWVNTGISIQDFPLFDATKNSFIVDVILWFEFDPTEISFSVLDKFSFGKGIILKKSPPETIKIKDKLFVRYDLRIQFSSNLDYKDFPFDNHRVVLSLSNDIASPEEMMFHVKESSFTFNPSLYTASWLYISHTVHKGYSTASLEKHDTGKTVSLPQVQMVMDFKGGWRKVFVIFVPLYLLSFMGAFTLIMQKDPTFLSLASISGLLAHRFVVENMSPGVGYFTLSDRLYVIMIIFSFVFFLINLGCLIWETNLTGTKQILFFLTLISWNLITYQLVLGRTKKRNHKKNMGRYAI